MNDIKVVLTGHGRGKVWLNGSELDHVLGIEFSASVDSFNEVRLTLGAEAVSIAGPAGVVRHRLPWWRRLLAPARGER